MEFYMIFNVILKIVIQPLCFNLQKLVCFYCPIQNFKSLMGVLPFQANTI